MTGPKPAATKVQWQDGGFDHLEGPSSLTTYTKNLTADLRSRLTSLMDPALLGRVDIKHIDQLAQNVLNENTAPGSQRSLIIDDRTLDVLREVPF
ncbi:hypothetical protein ACFU98_25450 [Streptomyces sp. NPDC057575]|uniref:hypothetical protein n=1 Tax=unclassified Streptomyces TaxID=2593676 RepID=UPI0036947521